MAEFCGTYTLVENCNMRAFAEATFPSTLNKITFHSGITPYDLFDLLAKTLCQLSISKDEFGNFKWVLTFDKDRFNVDEDVHGSDVGSGLMFKTTCRIGEEFTFSIPISGEKAKSSIKRQVGNSNALEQIAHFTSGHVEITYVRHDNDLKLNYHHIPSGTMGGQLFKKSNYFEVYDRDFKPK